MGSNLLLALATNTLVAHHVQRPEEPLRRYTFGPDDFNAEPSPFRPYKMASCAPCAKPGAGPHPIGTVVHRGYVRPRASTASAGTP